MPLVVVSHDATALRLVRPSGEPSVHQFRLMRAQSQYWDTGYLMIQSDRANLRPTLGWVVGLLARLRLPEADSSPVDRERRSLPDFGSQDLEVDDDTA